jgi:6-pyruvoyltetrahydropterin/6-carboxytetrahydropterin synthase
MKVTISRKAHFNSAHRLYRRRLDFQETMLFFKCVPNYHGHNYELIVGVTGHILIQKQAMLWM